MGAMTNANNPGPRPSNPRLISFADDCFAVDGTVTEHTSPRRVRVRWF